MNLSTDSSTTIPWGPSVVNNVVTLDATQLIPHNCGDEAEATGRVRLAPQVLGHEIRRFYRHSWTESESHQQVGLDFGLLFEDGGLRSNLSVDLGLKLLQGRVKPILSVLDLPL
jgi:hypothetical protein